MSTEVPTVIVISAGDGPGPDIAAAFAARGARVIALDDRPDALDRLTSTAPSRIEPLAVPELDAQSLQSVKDGWGQGPIDMVVNLMPMRAGGEISDQMRLLTAILRTMIRGLVAGQGAIVSLVPAPRDNLALGAQGLWGAIREGSAALGAELAEKSVRVHALSVSKGAENAVPGTLVHLAGPEGRQVASAPIRLR